jgi:hypothetical protein
MIDSHQVATLQRDSSSRGKDQLYSSKEAIFMSKSLFSVLSMKVQVMISFPFFCWILSTAIPAQGCFGSHLVLYLLHPNQAEKKSDAQNISSSSDVRILISTPL